MKNIKTKLKDTLGIILIGLTLILVLVYLAQAVLK